MHRRWTIRAFVAAAILAAAWGCALPQGTRTNDGGGAGGDVNPTAAEDTIHVADGSDGDGGGAVDMTDTLPPASPGDTSGDETTDGGAGDGSQGAGEGQDVTPPAGGGPTGDPGGDAGNGGATEAPVTANLVFDGPSGARVEMNPLIYDPIQFMEVSTRVAITPTTEGMITFLCDAQISLGDVTFTDAAGGAITLEAVTFDRGSDFECGQEVNLVFSLPASVTLASL